MGRSWGRGGSLPLGLSPANCYRIFSSPGLHSVAYWAPRRSGQVRGTSIPPSSASQYFTCLLRKPTPLYKGSSTPLHHFTHFPSWAQTLHQILMNSPAWLSLGGTNNYSLTRVYVTWSAGIVRAPQHHHNNWSRGPANPETSLDDPLVPGCHGLIYRVSGFLIPPTSSISVVHGSDGWFWSPIMC